MEAKDKPKSILMVWPQRFVPNIMGILNLGGYRQNMAEKYQKNSPTD
jgi:hypothetical protein